MMMATTASVKIMRSTAFARALAFRIVSAGMVPPSPPAIYWGVGCSAARRIVMLCRGLALPSRRHR
jgi:hypothetical protein